MQNLLSNPHVKARLKPLCYHVKMTAAKSYNSAYDVLGLTSTMKEMVSSLESAGIATNEGCEVTRDLKRLGNDLRQICDNWEVAINLYCLFDTFLLPQMYNLRSCCSTSPTSWTPCPTHTT